MARHGAARCLEHRPVHFACRASLERDGVPMAPPSSDGSSCGPGYSLARYNDPSTPAPLRRNELLVPLDAARFDIWGSGSA